MTRRHIWKLILYLRCKNSLQFSAIKYLRKKLHLRSLIGFRICLCFQYHNLDLPDQSQQKKRKLFLMFLFLIYKSFMLNI